MNFSDACTSAHEDSITCPLEVSELEPLEHELSDLENKLQVSTILYLYNINSSPKQNSIIYLLPTYYLFFSATDNSLRIKICIFFSVWL